MATIQVPNGMLGAYLQAGAKQNTKAVSDGIRAGAERGRALVVKESPVYDGLFRAAWTVLRDAGGMGATLSNSAPYAGVIEAGARPHGVSKEGQELIREWIRKKLMMKGGLIGPPQAGQRSNYGKKASPISRGEADEGQYKAEIDKILGAILHKIATKGQAGKFIVKNNLDKMLRYTVEEIVKELRKAMDNPKR